MLLQASRDSRLYAYVVLSVMTGLRTEELRAMRWNEVDLVRALSRSTAPRGHRRYEDTEEPRVLGLPQLAVEALREHHKLQAADRLKAGALWQDDGLVFASSIGTPLTVTTCAASSGRSLKRLAWVPTGCRGIRHTFVSRSARRDAARGHRRPRRP